MIKKILLAIALYLLVLSPQIVATQNPEREFREFSHTQQINVMRAEVDKLTAEVARLNKSVAALSAKVKKGGIGVQSRRNTQHTHDHTHPPSHTHRYYEKGLFELAWDGGFDEDDFVGSQP